MDGCTNREYIRSEWASTVFSSKVTMSKYIEFVELFVKCENANEEITKFLEVNAEQMSHEERLKALVSVENGPTWKRSNMVKELLYEQREELNKSRPKKTPVRRAFVHAAKRLKFTDTKMKQNGEDGWPINGKWFSMEQAWRLTQIKMRFGTNDDYKTEEEKIEKAKDMVKRVNRYQWWGKSGDWNRQGCIDCLMNLIIESSKCCVLAGKFVEYCKATQECIEAAQACVEDVDVNECDTIE